MTDETKPDLLERIKTEACEALPLWQLLLLLGLIGVPILLGFGYAALAERTAWRLHSDEYQTIVWVQWGAAMVLFFAGFIDIHMGWSRKLLRRPDPRDLPPGPFRLGSSLIGVYYRPWWGVPLIVTMSVALSNLLGDNESAISVYRVFWDSWGLAGWFSTVISIIVGLIALAGLFIRLRLRERD